MPVQFFVCNFTPQLQAVNYPLYYIHHQRLLPNTVFYLFIKALSKWGPSPSYLPVPSLIAPYSPTTTSSNRFPQSLLPSTPAVPPPQPAASTRCPIPPLLRLKLLSSPVATLLQPHPAVPLLLSPYPYLLFPPAAPTPPPPAVPSRSTPPASPLFLHLYVHTDPGFVHS
jgi:hypothetical protein